MVLALGFALAVAALWSWVVATGQRNTRALSQRHAQILSTMLVDELLENMGQESKEAFARHLARLARAQDLRVRVRDARGAIRFSWDPGEVGSIPGEEAAGPAAGDGTVVFFRHGLEARGPCLECHGTPGQRLGELEIEVPVSWLESEAVRTANRLALGGAVVLAAVIATALLGSLFLNLRIRRLARSMERAAEGDLGYRAPRHPPDDIGRLGDTFNHLLDELQATRRRQEEAHRLETVHMEQLAATGELAAGAAHELKNALGAFSVTLDALIRREEERDQRERILRLREKLEEVHGVVRGLLEFARPRTPRLDRVDPLDCIDRVLRVLDGRIRKAGAVVRQHAQGEIPVIRADRHLIGQVLINLLTNALEARPQGLELDIEVRAVGGDKAGGAEHVHILVRDNGPGIHPDELPHIFRPFHTTKHRSSGTGLGLAVSRDIVRRHHGELRAESEVGRGTCFTVALPVRLESGAVEDACPGGEAK